MKINNLITMRKLYNFKQSEIADHLGVSVATYNYYENGKYPIPSDKLIELAILFETSIDYLLGRKKIVRITTFENVEGEYKEVPTISEQVRKRIKKKEDIK